MPYTPSVQDRSGEILAQGISQGFSSLTQGVEKYYKKKEENEFLNTAIQGKLGMALKQMQDFQANKAAYGGIAPLNPEMLEKFQNIGGASTAKLKALNADFDVMLQRSANGMKEAGAESQRLQNVVQTNLLANSLAISKNDNLGMLNAGRKIMAVKQGELTPETIFRIGSEAGLSPGAMAQFSESAKDLLPKPVKVFQQMTLDQINALKGKGYDVKARPVANGMYEVENVSPFAPGAVTNINTGVNAFEATVGKAAAERLGGQYDAAKLASRTAIPKLDQTLSILQNQEPNTGILAELATNVDRVRATLLNEKGAAKRVSDTQLLESMLGGDVFTSLGAINLGSRNIDTPKEREFLQKVITGEIKLEKSTLIKMTEMRRKLQYQVIDNYNEDVKNGDYDEYFKAARIKPHTFDVPAIGGTTPPPPMSSGVPLPPGWTRKE